MQQQIGNVSRETEILRKNSQNARDKEHYNRDFPGGPVVETLPSTEGAGSIPGQRARIPYVSRPKGQGMEQKLYCGKFNNNFKGGPHQKKSWDFPGDAVVKNPPGNAGDTGSSPGLGRSHMPRSN